MVEVFLTADEHAAFKRSVNAGMAEDLAIASIMRSSWVEIFVNEKIRGK